jgi:hypothetical protein
MNLRAAHPCAQFGRRTMDMSQHQERKEQNSPAGRAPSEQAPGSRSGEGAASAMEQLISQDRRRQQEGRIPPDGER